MPTLTNKIGQEKIMNLLSNPGNHSKSEDHGHEVLEVKREELAQTCWGFSLPFSVKPSGSSTCDTSAQAC